jgi:hypothetical protein
MRSNHYLGAAALAVLVAGWGCGGDEKAALETPAAVSADENQPRPRTITAEGCLTGEGERFVLTDLASGRTNETATESYRLIGMDAELRSLVGQRVQVTGEAQPEQVVEVREVSPPAATGAAATPGAAAGTSGGGSQPQVDTVQSTRLVVGDLRVASVNATGARCTS